MVNLDKYCDSYDDDIEQKQLKIGRVDTPLGKMIVVSDESQLFLLEFDNRTSLEKQIQKLKIQTKSIITPGTNSPMSQIQQELQQYFAGHLTKFSVRLCLTGSPFQKLVWQALSTIPYGKTISYIDLARSINKPLACRAAANANGANKFAIIIPCHRVIHNDGGLGGYAGGLDRKRKLLEIEGAFFGYQPNNVTWK